METKQTAVEWFFDKLENHEIQAKHYDLYQQAKAMEKEQIKDAWKDSNYHRASENVLEYSSNEYYEETYGTRQSNN